MDGHLTEERLAAVLGEDVAPADAAHLAACAVCRARLDERRRDEALFGELARAVPPARVEPAALLTADAIPGYELLGEIQCGGQGTVYLARQRSTRREVALKVLARGSDATPRERRRFEREVDLASRLRHPGIVRVYESGESAGRPWYAMELAEGERLDARLRARTLDRGTRLALFERVADAVAYAHRSGVIHRDLKPANILVDREGAPRIVDFGLALAASERPGERLTATGEFLGTLDWSSPEQVRGDAVDTRTDVHALGLLLYSMLTGRLPWPTSGSVSELLRRIEHDPPLDPRGLSREVDDELRTILVTALAKDPAGRYASADALLRDLRHWRAREPLEARAHSTGYVLRFASAHAPQGMAFEVYTVADRLDPIVSQGFVRITPQYTYETCPAPDIVVVPGGSVPVRSESLRAWLTTCAEKSELVMSVCNGASALAVAGLLDGLEATTHRSALRSVQILAPEATVLENRRFVDSGRILTCAGVSAGIDGALHVVERLHGTEVARATATYMEYDWRPEAIAELHARAGQPVAGPAFELLELVQSHGPERALAERRRREAAGEPVASEADLNRLGYGLLTADRRDDAVQILELVTAAFPTSANACDSLAEAYELTGRDTDALTWSTRGLELLPRDESLTGPRATHVREALEARAARLRSGETAGAWACPPCGQPCDGKRVREPGHCANEECGMELVRVGPERATD